MNTSDNIMKEDTRNQKIGWEFQENRNSKKSRNFLEIKKAERSQLKRKLFELEQDRKTCGPICRCELCLEVIELKNTLKKYSLLFAEVQMRHDTRYNQTKESKRKNKFGRVFRM